MTASHVPAHKLCWININNRDIIFAATGPCIQSLSLDQGDLLSVWPRDKEDDSSNNDQNDEEERPMKRLKLENANSTNSGREGSEASEASIEIIAEGKQRQKGERRRPKIPDTTLPNVSHLLATSDGKNVVAVTAEDKTVRVLSVSHKGRLRQLSSRSMPKKCCAIALTPDEHTILTADKFGDVYALPLMPAVDYEQKIQSPQPERTFEPSASALTVHTKGNLDALRQQQRQKKIQPKKEGPKFEHKLLLGHVSLLTDLAVAWSVVEGKARHFIITADRDEHIRVSRGIPQTHVIDNFCLGHTEFVSKLCIIPWAQHLLLAGNGEPSLRLYSWQDGLQRSRYDLIKILRDNMADFLPPDRSIEKVAVSGIWPVRNRKVVLVAVEGMPLLFSFGFSDFKLRHLQTIKLHGNVLDVVHAELSDHILVSIDTVHESGSLRHYRDEALSAPPNIQKFVVKVSQPLSNTNAIPEILFEKLADNVNLELASVMSNTLFTKTNLPDNNQKESFPEKTYSSLGEFIYGLENLRKRRGKMEDEDVEEVQVDDGELGGAPDME